MPTKQTLLSEVRAAVAKKKSETGERNAVVRVLAKHGAYSTPKIEQGRFGKGATLRVYIWKTDWGTLILSSGPSVEGEVQWATKRGLDDAPEGVYHELEPVSRSAMRFTRGMDKIAAKQPVTGGTKVTRPKRKKKAAPKRKRKTAPKRGVKMHRPLHALDEAEYEEWRDSRETSMEVARAIWAFAETPSDAERIWEDPSPKELELVTAQAWSIADDDEDELYWGRETILRRPGVEKEVIEEEVVTEAPSEDHAAAIVAAIQAAIGGTDVPF